MRGGRRLKAKVKQCGHPQCTEIAHSDGLCSKHYTRRQRSQVARINAENERKDPPPLDKWHCVYVVGCEEFLPLKIGRTTDIFRRLEGMQTGCPFQLKFYGGVFAPKHTTAWLEKLVHDKLEEFDMRLRQDFRSEWFDLDVNDAVAVIEKCAEIENMKTIGARDYIKAAQRGQWEQGQSWVNKIKAMGFLLDGFHSV